VRKTLSFEGGGRVPWRRRESRRRCRPRGPAPRPRLGLCGMRVRWASATTTVFFILTDCPDSHEIPKGGIT